MAIGKPIDVTVRLEADSQHTHEVPELERLTKAMEGEIRELGVSSVDVAPSRPGVKGDFLWVLAIAVVPVVLSTLISYLREWARRPHHPPVIFSYDAVNVRVTLEFSGSGEPDFDISEVVAAVVDIITKGREA